MNSFIRWAGSKRSVLGEISDYCPRQFSTYVEPFVGSASLFFRLRPAKAVLGDINRELITTFREVRDNTEKVVSRLSLLKRGKNNYLEVRALDPTLLKPVDTAARFIYLNHYCFNGLFRVNSHGKFNVPYFPNKTTMAFRKKLILESAELLLSAKFVMGDFSETLAYVKKNDFVYLDPPYATNDEKCFLEYNEKTFSTDDLKRLSKDLNRIDKAGGKFLISYSDCKEARSVLKKWNLRLLKVRRNIAGFTGNRRSVFELLGSNY